jgi:hypothetical protein
MSSLLRASLSSDQSINAGARGHNCHLSRSNKITSDGTAVLEEDRPKPIIPAKARMNRKLNAPVFHGGMSTTL